MDEQVKKRFKRDEGPSIKEDCPVLTGVKMKPRIRADGCKTTFSKNGTLNLTVHLNNVDKHEVQFSKNIDTSALLQPIKRLFQENLERHKEYTVTYKGFQCDSQNFDSFQNLSDHFVGIVESMKNKSISNEITIYVMCSESDSTRRSSDEIVHPTPRKFAVVFEQEINNKKESETTKVYRTPVKRKSLDDQVTDSNHSSPMVPLDMSPIPPSSPTDGKGVVGIKNLRNTCFANVIFQSLSNSLPFRTFFERLPEVGDKSELDSGLVYLEMKNLLALMWSGKVTRQDGGVNPQSIVNCIQNKKNINYEFGTEDDAHWFLHLLLQIIDDELIQSLGMNYSVTKLFQTGRFTQILCGKCKHIESVKTDDITIYTLPIPEYDDEYGTNGHCSLMECLVSSIMSDTIDCITCSSCNNTAPMERKMSMTSLPPILCIHFNRYKWTGKIIRRATRSAAKAKINTVIDFPIILNLSECYSLPNKERDTLGDINNAKQPIYRLAALIVHEGLTPASGHYYVYCYNELKGKWYKFDDSRIPLEVEERSVLSSNPFMLFYTQQQQ